MRATVHAIRLTSHPTQPHLRLGSVGGFQVVVGDHYEDGTPGVFIPGGAIVPDKLAEEMWVKGRLAGKQKDRVKAREMRGSWSDGLFYGSRYFEVVNGEKVYHDGPSWNPAWVEGQDVTEELGIVFDGPGAGTAGGG
jgi:hypothetical protein